MSYIRVIPRDLFNEASLLKCLATLYIALDGMLPNGGFSVEDVDRFIVEQDPNDGSIYVENVPFYLAGRHYRLSRPLNSRQPWPLYLTDIFNNDFDPIAVFNNDGTLSDELLNLIKENDRG